MRTLVLSIALLAFSFSLKSQTATIKETTQIFRTYGYSDPDPVARPGKIYPYNRFDGYTNEPIDKEWKIIELENEWIKVLIAPEIGGKILGAIEKSTGNEFLYLNKVIKFRDVAMRGAWTSGGIEFNFGSIGHAPATSSPVNYMIQENYDGSVSCFLGDMDITSRTEWRVEVRLPNDKAWFETHANWYNTTDYSTSKYHWMNAAAAATDDLTYYWPGTNYIGHNGDSHAWPIMADGRDISQYAQNDYGTYHSYHVLGEISDYYGGYYKDKDFGFGHLTDYATKPGKKIWIWGLSRQGEIWVDLLTDQDLGDGQYTEIQTGLLFNQAALESTKTPYKHLELKSHDLERFTEYWFPVKQTGGISEITEHGILNIIEKPRTENRVPNTERLEIKFCALQSIQDSVSIILDNSNIYTFWADLKPMEVYQGYATKSYSHPSSACNFHLSSWRRPGTVGNGNISNNPTTSDRPTTSPTFSWTSLQGKYYKALEYSRQREYAKALQGYYDCLEEDQNYIPALIGAAEELMRTMRTDNAENLIQRALAIDTYHPQANYLYGIIKKQKGEYHRAKEAFGISTRNMEYRAAGFAQLAEVAFLMHDFERTLQYCESAVDYNRFNINAYKIMTLAQRHSGEAQEAQHTIEGLLQLDPLNHFARFEIYLNNKNEQSLKTFQESIKTEFPDQVYLELALFYHNLGLNKDATQVLSFAPETTQANYFQAFITNDEKRVVIPTKVGTSPHRQYTLPPFRPEIHKAITHAEKTSSNWQNRYYLGLMEWNFSHKDEARKLFRSCGDEPDFAAFYLARTKLFEGIDTELVVHDLERALKLEPKSWRSYKYSIDFYMKHNGYAQALELAQKAARKFKDNFIIQAALAKVELYNGNYSECLEILDELVILPAEGAMAGHDLYRQAHLLQAVEEFKNKKDEKALEHIAKAREWPENLGVGKPYVTDERIENYLEGIIRMANNEDKKAVVSFEKIITYTEEHKPSWGSAHLLLAYSYQLLGEEERAVETLSDWLKSNSKNPIAHWASALYSNNPEKAARALGSYKDADGGTPWNPGGGDSQFKLVYEIVNQIKFE